MKTFLLIFTLFILTAVNGQGNEWIFDRQTIRDGLSNTYITDITKDSKGYIWIATQNGLNKYDAYSYQIFKNDPNDSTSISSDQINCVFEDRKGNLWIGTDLGLNLYNRTLGEFTYWQPTESEDEEYVSSPSGVTRIVEDYNGILWLGTKHEGVIGFNPEKNSFERLDPVNLLNKRLYEPFVRSLLVDKKENLWIGTNGYGIIRYNTDTKKITWFLSHLDQRYASELSYTFALHEDEYGRIWAGTFLGGLAVFEPQKSNFRFIRNPNNPDETIKNGIVSISQSKPGELLLGSNGGGLFIFDSKKELFIKSYNYNPMDQNSLSDDFVGEIYVDESGIVWIGTENGGVSIYDPNARKFNLYKKRGDGPHDLPSNIVNAIYEDENGRIWIGTENSGFASFDRQTNTYKKFTIPSSQFKGGNTFVKSIIGDGEGNMWIATTMGGLSKVDTNGVILEQYSPFIKGSGNIKQDDISTLTIDSKNNIWLAGYRGIEKKNDLQFSNYCHEPLNQDNACQEAINDLYFYTKNQLLVGTVQNGFYFFNTTTNTFGSAFNTENSKLSHNTVNSFYLDRKSRLWIATENGLNQFHFEDSSITVLYKSDGLPDNKIYGILEDNLGNLWISTSFGLCRFNPDEKTFKNYYESDGLQSNVFRLGAYFKSKSGELFFGGVGGFNSFYPEDIKSNPNPPPIVFTDIQVFNQSFKRGDIPSVEVLIDEASSIKLNYDESIFSFEFAALNYTLAEKNEYAYMLEGFHDDWQYIGQRRFITFTNISPGSYTLKLKAANNDGLWNEEGISLKIEILPPFWATWWFRTLMIMVFIGLIYGIYKWRVRSIKRQNKMLEEEVKIRTQEVVEQRNEIASQKELVDQKNTDITASIRYSKRIQESFLPDMNDVKKYFIDAFVFFQPKDIVSGDFYWFETNLSKNILLFAVADCTGHGVPGAMVSVLGNNGLNQSVNELGLTEPAEILNNLNAFIQRSFDKKDQNVQDGMDMALCQLNLETNMLQFAGANNPIWIARNNEIHVLSGTKQPIGNYRGSKPFNQTSFQLESGDWIFLFSDGFADQFGGPLGKKFKYAPLKTALLNYNSNNHGDFENYLSTTFDQWKGKLEQVDDVCIVGINIK